MNQRQRQHRYERRRAHMACTKERGQIEHATGVPPPPKPRPARTKRALRAIGRKVRLDRG